MNKLVPISMITVVFPLLACSLGNPAVKTVGSYLNQKKCADRAQFILDSKRLASPLMTHYADKSDCVTEHEKIDATSCKDIAVGDYCSVKVEKISPYCVKRVADDDYKIDWPCSTGWNEMSIPAFQTEFRYSPKTFRVEASLGDDYNYGYSELKDTHYSIDLWAQRKKLTGYASKGSAVGKKLFALLGSGNTKNLTVTVIHRERVKDRSLVDVVSIVREDWRTITPAAGAAKP